MEMLKKKIYNIILSIMYFSRQIVYVLYPMDRYFFVGNLDTLYIFAPIYLFNKVKEIKQKGYKIGDMKISNTTAIFFISCVIYLILQSIFIQNLNILKALINITKIIVCYLIMKYFKQYYNKFDINFICKAFSTLCAIFLIFAIIFPNSLLWRHNDVINKYDLNRLQFLYAEPSELGLHAMLIIIIYTFMIFNSKDKKDKLMYIAFTIPIIVSLILAKPLGAIGIGGIAIVVLLFAELIINFSKKKLKIYLILLVIVIIVLSGLVITKNSLYLRVIDTLKGEDASNNYRIIVPFTVATQSVIDTYGIGAGFGNAKLSNNVEKYKHLGLEEEGIINSYMNLITESGIFGIVLVSFVIASILKKSIEDKSTIKIALSVFIIIYQFVGTYFTNPLCWIVYGIILSDFNFKSKLK